MTSEPDRVPPELFDEDYLYFYEMFLTPAEDDADAALVARLLDLRGGEAILDAPCGHGRLSRRLAAAGATVTGIDRSTVFLQRARTDAAAAGVEVDYREGDLRALPVPDAAFDVVLNWYTSFGYFDDAGNAAFLRELHRVVRPGGRVVIDVMNPAAVIHSVSSRSSTLPSVTWRGKDHMLDETAVDLDRGLFHTRHSLTRDGRTRTMRYTLRFHFPTELRSMLHRAGFRKVRVSGDEGGRLLVTDSRMIVIAERPT